MRLIIIDVNYKHSSTGYLVYNNYLTAIEHNSEVAVCYGRGKRQIEQNIFKFGIDIETYFHALLTRITGLTGIFSPISTQRLINYIEKFAPDIVQIHELHAYFVNYGKLLKYLKNKKIHVVYTFHCDFMFTGKCGVANNCDKWRTMCNRCPQKRDYPKSLFFDFSKKMYIEKRNLFDNFQNIIIVATNHWMENRIRMSFFRNKRIEVIHNGIDTDKTFYPKRYDNLQIKHNTKDKKVILAVAPKIFSEHKGGKFVLKIAKQMINQNTVFIIIGAEKYKKYENVIILEKIQDKNELAEYYSMADVFLLTSRFETFSLTCIEAIACGTPVVGFKAGAPENIFTSKYLSFVEYGSVDMMIEKINMYIEMHINPTEIVKYARENFDITSTCTKYLNLYQQSAKMSV